MTTDLDYASEHKLLFGHAPITDIKNKGGCIHPMHQVLTAMLDAPGVDLEIDFVPQEIVSTDDPASVADNEDYNRTVQEYKDAIKRIEEEDERERRGKTQF